MNFRIIYLPSFKAISSGLDKNFDFSEEGKLGQFDKFFSELEVTPRDNFMPRDFLFYDTKNQGFVWWWALIEGQDTASYEVVDFDGGYYLTYHYQDGDDKENEILYSEALKYINESDLLELDIRENHYPMGHVITPPEISEKLAFTQMETYIPVKVK